MRTIITKSIGAGNGASQSALDVVLAVSQTTNTVKVIAQKKTIIPDELDGYSLRNIRTYKTPEFTFFPDTGQKKTYTRMLTYFIAGALIDRFRFQKINQFPGNTVIINSFSAHRFWLPVYNKLKWAGILIVRESPRHPIFNNKPLSPEQSAGIFKYYKKFIFVSSNVMYEWIGIHPELKKISRYIPNCVHETEINSIRQHDRQQIRSQLGIKKENFNVVCVANIIHRKGQDILLKAVPGILKKIPEFKLILVGSATSRFAKNLIKNVKQSDFRNNVIFAGSRPDALKYIYSADVFLLASRAEALPRVILEAMALGTPVMSTPVDGVTELIDDGKSGILFRQNEMNKMIEGLTAIRKNPQTGIDLAGKGEQKYWADFSRELQIQRYKNLLKEES